MGLKNAAVGGAMAGVGLLTLVIFLIVLLFKIALLILVFGGAYLLLKHLGVLMAVPLL